MLFMGCRNHNVYPYNYVTQEIKQPLTPPHFGAVTSLAIVGDTLISGSRDKNLRSWDYTSCAQKYPDYLNAHTDQINCLETDFEKQTMYSGGKDGIVKVWTTKNQRLDCMANLQGHSASINSLCKIEHPSNKMFASGSSDKSIKMWKLKRQTAGNMSDEEDEALEDIADDNDDDVVVHIEESKEDKSASSKQGKGKISNLQQMRINKKARKDKMDM